jgi:hypothetical protein
MGQAIWAYGAVALLLVASAGPVLAAVRDASLDDLGSLSAPRTLSEFPFLQAVEPYLPPIVVDWLIIRPDADLEIPPEVAYRLDRDGRVILVWPDGCEEYQEQYRQGSLCAPPEPDCAAPDMPGCTEYGLVCAEDERIEDGACVPLDCDTGNATRDDGCKTEEDEEEDEEPRCPSGSVPTTDDGCIALATHQLRRVYYEGGEAHTSTHRVDLRAPYENLSLELEFSGIPAPDWRVKLYDEATNTNVCWVLASNPGSSVCEVTAPGSLLSGNRSYHDDGARAPLPAGRYVLVVEYDPGTGTNQILDVQVFGRPADGEA